jgi:hypothetical protein
MRYSSDFSPIMAAMSCSIRNSRSISGVTDRLSEPCFLPAGAETLRRDLPDADVRAVRHGHFDPETHCEGLRLASFRETALRDNAFLNALAQRELIHAKSTKR